MVVGQTPPARALNVRAIAPLLKCFVIDVERSVRPAILTISRHARLRPEMRMADHSREWLPTMCSAVHLSYPVLDEVALRRRAAM